MQWFRVELKTFLGLAMPNQCCDAVTKLILGWFVGGNFRQETLNLNDPYMYKYNEKSNFTVAELGIKGPLKYLRV